MTIRGMRRHRTRAERIGRSMVEEVQVMLTTAVGDEAPARPSLVKSIRRHIVPIRGVEFDF